jgi:hypothetical protein
VAGRGQGQAAKTRVTRCVTRPLHRVTGVGCSTGTTSQRLTRTVVALLAGLSLGACRADPGGSAESGVPTAAEPGRPTTTTAPRDEVNDYVDAMRAYARCLRGEGLDVGDPDETGAIELPNQNKADPKHLAAHAKCASLRPPVPAAVEELRRPKRSEAQVDTARRYARCMQENGAPDFPDPGPDGYAPRSAEGWDQSAPGALRAGRVCAPVIGDPTSGGPGLG